MFRYSVSFDSQEGKDPCHEHPLQELRSSLAACFLRSPGSVGQAWSWRMFAGQEEPGPSTELQGQLGEPKALVNTRMLGKKLFAKLRLAAGMRLLENKNEPRPN